MTRSRGPRGAGTDTRGDIVAAAAAVFMRDGYAGTSMRAIAREASVDPAMVRHWFDSKVELFVAALRPAERDDPRLVALAALPPTYLGEALVRIFSSLWDDPVQGPRLATILRAAVADEDVAEAVRGVIIADVLEQVLEGHPEIPASERALRASLAASQMIGLAAARHLLGFAALESADLDTLVAAYGPTLQRYLTGDLSPVA